MSAVPQYLRSRLSRQLASRVHFCDDLAFVVAAWPHTQAQLPCVEEEMDNRGGKCKVEKQEGIFKML